MMQESTRDNLDKVGGKILTIDTEKSKGLKLNQCYVEEQAKMRE